MELNRDINTNKDANNNVLFNLIKHYFSKEKETNSCSYREKLYNELTKYLVKTDDGSYTFNYQLYDENLRVVCETMHTNKGAISESFEKFVNPLKINYNEDIAILDICSGFGYNSAAFLDEFFKRTLLKTSNKLSIDMIEASYEIIAVGLVIPSPIATHRIIKKIIESKLLKDDFISLNLETSKIPDNIAINLFCEEGRDKVLDLPDDYYDIIFLDPFSPKLTPELYSLEFFIELKRIIKDNGMIITYTSSAPVRSAFIEANFHIGEGPIFGRKSGGTIASPSFNMIDKDISFENERMIALSDVGIPFKDPNLNLDSYTILMNRKNQRSELRNKYKISSAVKTPIFLGNDIKDEKLKRRVLRNLNNVNIPDLNSAEANYIISPQDHTNPLCFRNNSKDRIRKMVRNLQNIIDDNSKTLLNNQ
jgi:tRNA U34 5-methylaminomethyl-2-thiouridine-forming methyltransferase MnmC